MRKMKRCFLLTNNINGIDLCMTSIKMHFYLSLVSHLTQFNTLKSVLYIENLAINQ